jgi:hypothetical protein
LESLTHPWAFLQESRSDNQLAAKARARKMNFRLSVFSNWLLASFLKGEYGNEKE